MARSLAKLSQADRQFLCSETIQRMISRLFDTGYKATEIATAQLRLYSTIAVLGMSREQAVILLRDAANRLERP